MPLIPKIGGIEDAEVRITACALYMCVLSVCIGDMYMYTTICQLLSYGMNL